MHSSDPTHIYSTLAFELSINQLINNRTFNDRYTSISATSMHLLGGMRVNRGCDRKQNGAGFLFPLDIITLIPYHTFPN
jgi:hypothetical protein